MELTFIGVLVLLIGLPIVVYGRMEAILGLVIGCGILGGASAINLPALGGSSIPPIHFALLLGAVRIFVPGSGKAPQAHAAIEANWPLLLYSVYGLAIAAIGPRLFRGMVALPPLRTIVINYIYAVIPLMPSSQNLTTSVYMLGTMLCAIVVYVACSGRDGGRVLVRAAVTAAWINASLGVAVAASRNTPLEDVFALFRNGNYAQLDQQYRSFIRLSGLFPEPSIYATYCFGWFCFLFECWYRDVMPRRTGPIALALFAILLASTSSSAYIGLAGFVMIWGVRLVVPGAVRSDKLLIMLMAILIGAMAASILFFVVPTAGSAFVEMVERMTFAKSQSDSGLQRAFWARKGLEAFTVSHGMGVGPGSFRSSSLIAAILGSTGVVGMSCVLIYLARVFRPLRASTYEPHVDERTAIGAAAGWAALMLLVPYSVIQPSCDLGTDFAIFGGAALALRAAAARRRTAVPPMAPGRLVPADG